MLNGFEDITYELTAEELKLVPLFAAAFKKYTKNNPISNKEIRAKLSASGIEVPDSRIRKIISYMTTEGVITNLGADSRGYYTITNREDLERYRESLEARANKILKRARLLEIPIP